MKRWEHAASAEVECCIYGVGDLGSKGEERLQDIKE